MAARRKHSDDPKKKTTEPSWVQPEVGDGICLHQEVYKHIGCNRRWIAYVSKGQVAQKNTWDDWAEKILIRMIVPNSHILGLLDTEADREEDDSKDWVVC